MFTTNFPESYIIPDKQTSVIFKALQRLAKPASADKINMYNNRVFASSGFFLATDNYVAVKVYNVGVNQLDIDFTHEVCQFLDSAGEKLVFSPYDNDCVTTICRAMQSVKDSPCEGQSVKIDPKQVKKALDIFAKLGLSPDIYLREKGVYMKALDCDCNTACEAVVMAAR